MDSETVFVHYDGIWDKSENYVKFKMIGILLPIGCTFSKLLELISSELHLNVSVNNVKIEYQLMQDFPPIKIDSDDSTQFYLELKKKDKSLTSYLLCLTNIGSSVAAKSGRETGVDTTSSESSYHTNLGSSMAAKSGREMGVDTASSESGYLFKLGSLMAPKRGREMGVDTGSNRNDYLIIPAKKRKRNESGYYK
ncbi:hypothetical protein PanWU01x14_247330 [Parasponia andersonii]|uniref:PB1 domain containing protein n=1 Tax=Parasponia andersonii TaxID=3476 RepID=A0A2P5BDY9_PARAD|nr:hypothetical protein PanWU01x14_247330 [Parasponia andersonii]